MAIIDLLIRYREGLLEGIRVTLELCLIIWSIGILAGGAFGYAGARWSRSIGVLSRGGSFFLSSIPILVVLLWLHYPLQAILNVVIDPFVTAASALTLVNVFAVADLVRGVFDEFPRQYVMAADACGLRGGVTFRYIQLPITLRQILPGLLTTQVAILQATLFASLISVDELFRVVQRINAETYRPVEAYSALALFYLLICLPLNGLAVYLRRKYTRNLSER